MTHAPNLADMASAPTPEQYRERLRTHLGELDTTPGRSIEAPLAECLGRITAEALVAPGDLPVFVNSQMDGYAVHPEDVAHATVDAPARLVVDRVVAAGSPPGPAIAPGHCVKIMTGAPVPPGGGCIVPVEDTSTPEDQPPTGGTTHVAIHAPRRPGEYLRTPGEDVRAGQTVLDPGTRLTARHLAAAASLGIPTLRLRPRIRVAVIATGAELVPPGRPLAPGQIHESNSLTLAAAATEAGCHVTTATTCDDDPDHLADALDAATKGADLVITVGGVSMGDFEVVRHTLGGTGWFGHVAMQPGGPQGLARCNDRPVVCFPGNPVSALVSWTVLLRPLLTTPPPPLRLRLTEALSSPPGRTQFRRGRLTSDGVTPLSGPGSHLVATMARADVLITVPADVTALEAGAELDCLPLA